MIFSDSFRVSILRKFTPCSFLYSSTGALAKRPHGSSPNTKRRVELCVRTGCGRMLFLSRDSISTWRLEMGAPSSVFHLMRGPNVPQYYSTFPFKVCARPRRTKGSSEKFYFSEGHHRIFHDLCGDITSVEDNISFTT